MRKLWAAGLMLAVWMGTAGGQFREMPAKLSAEDAAFVARLNRVYHAAAEAVGPAVVFLKADVRQPNRPDEPIYEYASGCIIDGRGYILTNNHVVEHSVGAEVMLADGRRFAAVDKYLDPATDLAVLRIEPGEEELPVAVFGDSDEVLVGQPVLAIGSPFNFVQTVTAGIISQKNRQTYVLGEWGVEDFLQTDAAINVGNSGGPLVNLYGEVVGINSNIYHPGTVTQSLGYAFAVPSNLARAVAEQLMEHQRVRRGFLGIKMSRLGVEEIRAMSRERQERMGDIDFTRVLRRLKGLREVPTEVEGVLVLRVYEGAAAERAGIRAGDIILSIEGREVRSSRELQRLISSYEPGVTVELRVWRDGGVQQINTELDDRGAARERMARGETAEESVFGGKGLMTWTVMTGVTAGERSTEGRGEEKREADKVDKESMSD